MKVIPLTQGKFALVDDADFERLSKHKWCATKGGHTFYAQRAIRLPDGKWTTIMMHREILDLGYGDPRESDHIKHNGLDNRRDNLRICTSSQNQQNRNIQKHFSSAYKGVSWSKYHKKWHVKVKINKKSIHIGYFVSEIKAAKAYDARALQIFGEFALPNFNYERV